MILEGVFLYFCLLDNPKIKQTMEMFLAVALSCVLFLLSLWQVIRNGHRSVPVEENGRLAPIAVAVTAVSILSTLSVISSTPDLLSFYLTITLSAVYPLTSSTIPSSWARASALAMTVLAPLTSVFSLLDKQITRFDTSSCIWMTGSVILCCLVLSGVMAGLFHRMMNIREVMRSSSVWASVCLCVDTAYIVIIAFIAIALQDVCSSLMQLIIISVITALCIRLRNGSVFVLLVNHERRIVESMKVSKTELSATNPGSDQLYVNIYERVLRYFENHKPYLNNELTINDIVEVVYTNKLYISKAISHCTGRNFCQFVNYYRVTYAVERFRDDPQLKVVDLANVSGFNSTTSFSAAFRLYMGENPGDWCRKERVRLSKK